LEHLDARRIATVRLDATPLGEPLYVKLGFVPQFQVARYAGSVLADAAAAVHERLSHGPGVLLPAVDEHIEEIVNLDQDATSTDRRSLLLALCDEYRDEVRVVIHERRVIGYLVSRPGATARQIGPCVADASAGERLLSDAVARHAEESLYIDVPLDNAPAVSCMESLGLAVQRNLTRMSRGGSVVEDTSRLFASSGPEKG
jgi:hypothetical protein